MVHSEATPVPSRRRRRIWPAVLLPVLVVAAIAAGWSAFWFYAADKAQAVLAAWSAREAQAGRHYGCGSLAIGGFPLRFVANCTAPTVDLASNTPPVRLAATHVRITGDVFDPAVLTAEIEGPLTVSVAGAPPSHATWSHAQLRLRGSPLAPGRLSFAVADLAITQMPGPTQLLAAKQAELQASLLSGTVEHDPVVEVAASLVGATAPHAHPLAAQPLDLSGRAVLSGLDNLRPLPLSARLRQLQAAGGRLEIADARFSQGEAVATASGRLGLTANARLDGTLQVVAAGYDRVLSQLGLDKLLSAGQARQVAPAISMLDSLVPGLGQVVRNKAGFGVAAGLAIIGKPAQLDGRQALAFPLRLADGAVFLGPLQVGQVAPLY